MSANGAAPAGIKKNDERKTSGGPSKAREPNSAADRSSPPRALSCLARHYGGEPQIDAEGRWWLALEDNRRLHYDDGRKKTLEKRLANPDLEDMLRVPYRRGPIAVEKDDDHDPGRVRHTELFMATYGDDAKAVHNALVPVSFAGHRVRVHRKAAPALRRVAQRLRTLKDPQTPGFLQRLGGTFKWRTVEGSDRLSAHAFGIALDLNPKKAAYWRWTRSWNGKFPQAIVDAFEDEGFIWGGRWYHFDTMHFEYRPELLDPHCRVDDSAGAKTLADGPVDAVYPWGVEPAAGETLRARVPTPPGYERVPLEPDSFGAWLRTLPIKPGRPAVFLHDGREKGNQEAHHLVVDIDTGTANLQQCADAVMRLRAEYLFSRGSLSDIHFDFTSGDRADYSAWAQGYRPRVEQNRVHWRQSARPNASYGSFRRYLTSVFTYAGTASLSRELHEVSNLSGMRPGDVFIQGGFPGHAVIVLDVARPKDMDGTPTDDASGASTNDSSTRNEALFLLGQSYMPAQDLHVLVNPNDAHLSPWYSTRFGPALHTPEWNFRREDLKRFQ